LDLGSKVGYRFSLPAAVKLTPHWALGVDPWLEFSGISESNHHQVAGGGGISIFEPESSTNIFGTTFTLQYGF
ncbi:MAG TPA: hypothetical protein VF889_09300, partial [Bacteroidota bacterium]